MVIPSLIYQYENKIYIGNYAINMETGLLIVNSQYPCVIYISPSLVLLWIQCWEEVKQANMTVYYVNLKDFCYTSKTYLTEVAYCETTEAGHETLTKNSPVLRATVPIHLLTSTHDKLVAHLCSIGWQAGGMGTSSHSLHPAPTASTTQC
jgi:hypothetical protein